MQRIIQDLQDDEMEKSDRVEAAMRLLGALYIELKKYPPPEEEVLEFKSKLTSLLTSEKNRGGVYSYAHWCEVYASRGRLDGFEKACRMRTVLQLLNDHFLLWDEITSEKFKRDFPEDLEEIDEMIEEVSDDAPPVREHDIPDWASESHWWWRAPKRQDMSEAERRNRLEYEHWDGAYD